MYESYRRRLQEQTEDVPIAYQLLYYRLVSGKKPGVQLP